MAPLYSEGEGWDEEALTPAQMRFAAGPEFDAAYEVIQNNCTMCHTPEPAWEGIAVPPRGVKLVTQSDVARHARQIYLQAGVTHAMPPGVANFMEPEDRASLVRWYRAAVKG